MRVAAGALAKLARLRKPAAQVGVLLVPSGCDLDTWERHAVAHQSALMTACAQDRDEANNMTPNLPDPMIHVSKKPSR